MKNLYYSMIAGILILTAQGVRSQDYKIPVQNTKDGKLTLVDFMGDLPIEGYSGTEIVVASEADLELSDEEAERSKGLKPVYSAGTDNTGIGIHMEKNGNQVTLQCLLPFTKSAEYRIKVPDNFAIKAESGCERNTEITVKNIKNEVDIKNCQSIRLTGISGPVVLSTISGDIDVEFTELNMESPISISNISGAIDVTLPPASKADLKMKTVTGNIYTDFEMPASDKSMKQVGGSSFEVPLNGGGVDFSLINVSGNIYLRKAK
jgi:DUF4097 and DUF4098 domain-containing protein YvlB